MTYVLDACAILALLKDEAGAGIVENLLVEAANGSCTVLMNKYNLLEVYYNMIREGGKEIADSTLLKVNASPIEIIDTISEEVLKEAGRLKASYRISIADSFALAEASVSGGLLLTSDHHEFDAVEKTENIRFNWIR